jgi:DUF1009 family protein
MPAAVAQAMLAEGRALRVIAIEGIAERSLDRFGATWMALGQLGRLFAFLRRENCGGVVMVGAMHRPALRAMRIDAYGWTFLFDFLRNIRRGDDGMLRGMSRWFEERGFPVLGIGEVAPRLLAPVGRLGAVAPPPEALAAARRGLACLDALSPFDVGQGLVVLGERIVAIEGAEGTDAMLARVAELRDRGRLPRAPSGVLVKAAKTGQSLKVDLPAIGPATIAGAAAAGLAGLAVEAGRLLILDAAGTAAAADAAGLFLFGLSRGPAA